MINFAIKLAATVAIEALSVGLQASQRTYGPRLDELTVTTADFGTPVPRFLGARKFACPVIWTEDLKEVTKTSKVKGAGKQTTYHYLATFMVAIADNPIDKVLKIWFDDKLVYDVTGTGPVSYANSLGIDLNAVMRIYLGSETQTPDPTYEAWCDNKYGANSAPAYRGVSTIVFDQLPVDNFGNRIPQISVLATAAANGSYPYETKTTQQSNNGLFAFNQSGGTLGLWSPTAAVEYWDTATRTRLGSSQATDASLASINCDIASDGTAYQWAYSLTGTNVYLYVIQQLGGWTKTLVTGWASSALENARVLDAPNGTRYLFCAYQTNAGYINGTTHVAHAQSARDFCLDDTGTPWAIFQPTGSSSAFTIQNLITGSSHTFTGSSRSGPGYAAIAYVAQYGHFVASSDGVGYIIDKATWTQTTSASGTFGSLPNNNAEKKTDLTTIWENGGGTFYQFSLKDGSLIESFPRTDWASVSTTSAWGFDPLNRAIWSLQNSGTGVYVFYLDRASNGGTTLGAIVSKMCDAAGLTDRDTSALTQSVAGYSWTRGDVKSQMEPVLDIHDVDARPHDFTIEFKPRGSAPLATLLTPDFARQGQGTPRYKVTETQDTDLPKTLRVNFADTGFDQQTNNVLSILPIDAVDSQRDNTIDLTTYAATPTIAQQLADRYMRRQWNGKDSVDLSLTAQQLGMEPGDVETISLDGTLWTAKLEKQTIVGSRMDCTFRRDEQAVATLNSSTTGPDMGARTVQVIVPPAPIKGFVIDAPFRWDSDQDSRPLLYSGAGAYGGLAFPGATIWEETGAGASAAFDQQLDAVTTGATWGTCNWAVGPPASPWLWDRANTLSVSLQSGSLTSCAEADVNADPTLNLILVGRPGNWEYLNFCTATLQGDGTYILSDLKRGRRGTEWACAGHTSSDVFILASALDIDEMGTDDVGANFAFKAQAIGRPLDAAAEIDLTPYSGATLKPYAPASIKWSWDGTNLTGTITRRTRIGGAWVSGTTIPLSETSENYQVDIYNGVTFKRTITVSGTNVFIYTAAMATADGITLPTAPSVNVYQMSDAVGRGYALAA